MLSIISDQRNPYFNIASEEYLLKSFTEEIFILYINDPSVILGKHQNAFSEINHRFTRENNIPVIRRLSGGGSVYHDAGNINFTFIINSTEGKQINFKRFTHILVEVLQDMGVPAECNNRNDILINNLKCSGNAEHVYKNRTLHHGTLLFSSDLNNLRSALNGSLQNFEDKAVKSIKSHVTNIRDFLPESFTIQNFKDKIISFISRSFAVDSGFSFSEYDILQINKLIHEKYMTWDWNYGYSPRFKLVKKDFIDGMMFELTLEAENGLIKSVKFFENGIQVNVVSELLTGIVIKEEQLL